MEQQAAEFGEARSQIGKMFVCHAAKIVRGLLVAKGKVRRLRKWRTETVIGESPGEAANGAAEREEGRKRKEAD